MRWWVTLLKDHTGSILVNPLQHVWKVYTDASTTTGYGCIFKGEYFRGEWSQEIKDLLVDFTLTINELELVCLNFALDSWGRDMAGSCLHFRCDNLACVYNIASMSSKIPVRAALLRRLYATAAHWGVTLKSTYINTHDNLHADTLSRGNMDEFFSLPQHYELREMRQPDLSSMDLLVNPTGIENPSSPLWLSRLDR